VAVRQDGSLVVLSDRKNAPFLFHTSQDTTHGGHTDQHALAVDPFDRNILLVASDGGVYYLQYEPQTNTTATISVNATLGVTEFYHAAFSTYDPDWILGGAQDSGSPFSNGTLSNWINAFGNGSIPDGGGVGVNPLNKNWMYLTGNWLNGQHTMLRTTHAWQLANEAMHDITPSTNGEPGSISVPVTIDPGQPWKMYTATNYLYKWDENTLSWTNHVGGQQLSGNNGYLDVITVADADSNRIYTGAIDGQIWMTADGGSTWTEIDTPSVNTQAINAISVNAGDANDVLVGIGGTTGSHLWRCTNPFAKPVVWTDVSAKSTSQRLPEVPVDSVARDPSSPAVNWYAGTDIGVFYTDDGGAHWYNATAPLGLPNAQVTQLTAVSQTGYLYAATFGRGVWRAKLGCQPQSCASTNASCGTISDGCGGPRDCGSCTAPATCGGGGTPNVCGVCVPLTCTVRCGSIADGCGGTKNCGVCPIGETCSNHYCVTSCGSQRACCLLQGCTWRNNGCICL
jgi:hypothetical protein